jgi:predicted amidohydrolase
LQLPARGILAHCFASLFRTVGSARRWSWPSPQALNPLIRFGNHVAAVAVCADIGSRAHPQQAAERGADSYLASMFVIPSDFDGEVLKLSRYAVQHRMMTALANFGSPSGGLRSAGRSSIWSETGELLVQLEASGSGIAVVTETEHGRRTRAVMVSNLA